MHAFTHCLRSFGSYAGKRLVAHLFVLTGASSPAEHETMTNATANTPRTRCMQSLRRKLLPSPIGFGVRPRSSTSKAGCPQQNRKVNCYLLLLTAPVRDPTVFDSIQNRSHSRTDDLACTRQRRPGSDDTDPASKLRRAPNHHCQQNDTLGNPVIEHSSGRLNLIFPPAKYALFEPWFLAATLRSPSLALSDTSPAGVGWRWFVLPTLSTKAVKPRSFVALGILGEWRCRSYGEPTWVTTRKA